jgi:hypothetical protein
MWMSSFNSVLPLRLCLRNSLVAFMGQGFGTSLGSLVGPSSEQEPKTNSTRLLILADGPVRRFEPHNWIWILFR